MRRAVGGEPLEESSWIRAVGIRAVTCATGTAPGMLIAPGCTSCQKTGSVSQSVSQSVSYGAFAGRPRLCKGLGSVKPVGFPQGLGVSQASEHAWLVVTAVTPDAPEVRSDCTRVLTRVFKRVSDCTLGTAPPVPRRTAVREEPLDKSRWIRAVG